MELSDWLRCEQVGLVVMEATGDYWKPPFYLLEDEFTCWLLDAKQVKHLPGRAKTDREDAIWLAKVAERGMAEFRAGKADPPMTGLDRLSAIAGT